MDIQPQFALNSLLPWQLQVIRSRGFWECIQDHGDLLSSKDFHDGNWNHGLDQDLALFALGCAIDREEWKTCAFRRATENFAASFDLEGACHEQATGYHYYSYARFERIFHRFHQYGMDLSSEFLKLEPKILEFVAHAVSPRGYWAQIGDTRDALASSEVFDTPARDARSPLAYSLTRGLIGKNHQIAPPYTSRVMSLVGADGKRTALWIRNPTTRPVLVAVA